MTDAAVLAAWGRIKACVQFYNPLRDEDVALVEETLEQCERSAPCSPGSAGGTSG